jgi:hypothetical protein
VTTPAPPAPPAPAAPPANDPGTPAAPATGTSPGDSGTGDIAVVLMVPADAAQALPPQADGETAPLFLSLAFLTKPSTMDPAAFLIAVLTAAREAAAAGQPVNGQINGLGRTSGGDGEQDEFFALVESPDIEPLRTALMSGVNDAAGSEQQAPADGSEPKPLVDPGVYLPKITLGSIDAGGDLPVQRVAPVAATFDTLTIVQDATLTDIPIGAPTLNQNRPALPPDQSSAAPPDSTAPAAQDAATKAGGPPISRGSYVKVGSQQGRVDLVVTTGKVPGVDSDVEGSASNPALRVVVYTESGGKWKATGKRIATRANSATRIAPLMNRPAKKDAGEAALVGLQADHESKADAEGWPPHARPDGDAIKSVYERGLAAWPGEQATTATAEDWALGRVKAFFATAAGARPDGYHRDDDLLPTGHPETKRLTVETDETKVVMTADDVEAALAQLRHTG